MAKILVIDDEEQMRFLLTRMLTRDGHEVFLAEDGVEGEQIFYQVKPDLVITEIVMPNKDGLEVIMELLKLNSQFPIIAMSGDCSATTANFKLEIAETLGAKYVLLKPFTHQQLQEVVQLALG
jgi:CheY-like chemotaxis protein